MKKNIIFVIILAFFLSGCSEQNTGSPSDNNELAEDISSATIERYRENEVREYKGARLDPAIGPRDNSIKGVQQVDMDTYKLRVDGLVNRPMDLEYDEILMLDAYERMITLHCVEGWDATVLWRGVLIKDILDLAVIKPEVNTVIFQGIDGYSTSIPLETILEREMILAYSANGLDLPPEMGYPFIVVAEDKLGYKWARWVTKISLSDNPEFRGYWEGQGYSNDAEI